MTGQRGANAAAANEPDAPANFPTENSGSDNVPIDLSLGEDWEDDARSEDHVEPPPISADAYFALTDEEKGQVPRDAKGLPFGYWWWSKEAWSKYCQENPRTASAEPAARNSRASSPLRPMSGGLPKHFRCASGFTESTMSENSCPRLWRLAALANQASISSRRSPWPPK